MRCRVCWMVFFFFFFFTLVTCYRKSLSLKLSDTRVYEPQVRARLETTAHLRMLLATSLLLLNLAKHRNQNPPHNDPNTFLRQISNYQQHVDVAVTGIIWDLNNFIRENPSKICTKVNSQRRLLSCWKILGIFVNLLQMSGGNGDKKVVGEWRFMT
jgi:hypothetical protein